MGIGEEEFKVHKIEGLWSAQERRQHPSESFKQEYLDEWFKDRRGTEEFNRMKLLEFIDELHNNDIYVRKIIESLFHKYHDEIKTAEQVRYLKHGWVQYMLENHQFEFIYEIIKVLVMKSNTFEKELTDTIKSVARPIYFYGEKL